MTDKHPITPPEELVEQWLEKARREIGTIALNPRETFHYGATQGARWGADQELEACCEWFANEGYGTAPDRIRTARRPKPPSLKEQALGLLNDSISDLQDHEVATIRKALEALPDD
jgi:hypothetical protein